VLIHFGYIGESDMDSISRMPWASVYRNQMTDVMHPVTAGDIYDDIAQLCRLNGSDVIVDRSGHGNPRLRNGPLKTTVKRSNDRQYKIVVYSSENKKNRPYHASDDVNSFLFIHQTGDWWAIPKYVLMEQGYVACGASSGRQHISLARTDIWAAPYYQCVAGIVKPLPFDSYE
jgi:hypothetical protein